MYCIREGAYCIREGAKTYILHTLSGKKNIAFLENPYKQRVKRVFLFLQKVLINILINNNVAKNVIARFSRML